MLFCVLYYLQKNCPWFPEILPAQKVVDLNKELKQYADKNNILYVDYFSLMINETMGMKKELAKYGVHPNKKDYLIMEKIFIKSNFNNFTIILNLFNSDKNYFLVNFLYQFYLKLC